MAAPEACRDGQVDEGPVACRLEARRDADQKNDLAGHRVHLDQWDAENRDDLGRLVADASAGRGAARSADHRMATDHGYQWAAVRDSRSEAGRDCRWAKNVEAACRAEQAPQRRADALQAEAGWDAVDLGLADVARANCLEHFEWLAAAADRAEPEIPAVGRKAPGCEARGERLA